MHAIVLLLAASAAAPAAAGDLSTLAWLAGHWQDEEGSEEVWLAPRDGLMPGLARSSGPQGPGFEYLRIVQRDGGLDYIAAPNGGASTAFRATELGSAHVRFENPAHDFPTWIEYRADGPGALRACIGDAHRERCWRWRGRAAAVEAR